MTQFGRKLAVAGILLMAVTVVLFGRDIERALQARCVAIVALEVGREATSEAVAAEPGRGCLVAVELRLRSSSVEKSGAAPSLRYSFPLACTALGDGGGELFAIRAAVRWDDAARLVRDESADASGGRARVQHNLPKFDAPPTGTLRVRATLMPDTEYGATVESARLKVYDNVVRPTDEIALAGVVLLAGPALLVLGVVLAIVGWARARRQRYDDEPVAGPTPFD